jgi:hypothetical protein
VSNDTFSEISRSPTLTCETGDSFSLCLLSAMMSCARFLFVSSHVLLLFPSLVGALVNKDMTRVPGLVEEIGESSPDSLLSYNRGMPSISRKQETQLSAPTSRRCQHQRLLRNDGMVSPHTMISALDSTKNPARGQVRASAHQSSPAPTSTLKLNPNPLGFLEGASQPMDLAPLMTPVETQTTSQSNAPTWALASTMPTTEVTSTHSPSQSLSPSSDRFPAATPTRTPITSSRLVQLPKFEVVLAGSLNDVHALTDTLSEYLGLVFLGTIGLEALQGIDLIMGSNHSDNGLTQLSWTGIASFDPPVTASADMVKSATVRALQNIAALQASLDSKLLQVGTVTVVRVHLLETNLFEPSASPSHMPSFRPSRGVIVTICTIQKTQIKCLANDCEWRNQFRKCRDFLKHEDIQGQNQTQAPYSREKGSSSMPLIDRVPPQDSVTEGLIIVSIVIASIVVLAIVGYVGKLAVVSWNKNLSPEHEGEASLRAELYGNDALPVSAPTSTIPTWLSSPSAGADNEEGLQEVYIRSED